MTVVAITLNEVHKTKVVPIIGLGAHNFGCRRKPGRSEDYRRIETLNTVGELRTAENKAALDLRTQEHRATQVSDQLKAKRVEIALVQGLIEAAATWQTNQTRRASVVESELAVANSLEFLRSGERKISPQLTAVEANESGHAEVDKNQSELKSLLSQLQGHIRTGICPLRGEDHGSKDALVRHIQRHLAADAASSAC